MTKSPTTHARAAKGVMFAAVLLLVGCDHATKHTARSFLMGRPEVNLVDGVLDLRYTENRAMAFGFLGAVPPNVRWPLVCAGHTLTVCALAAACWRLRRRGVLLPTGLYLALAGGAGNLIDRLTRGYVIDFIHIRWWPVFNVADMCVCAGMAVLLLHLWRNRSPARIPG